MAGSVVGTGRRLIVPRKDFLLPTTKFVQALVGRGLPVDLLNQLETITQKAYEDEIANYIAIERYINSSTSAGLRAATRIVAASNSLDTKDVDYTCSGAADDIVINKAFTDVGSGGRVLCLDGDYTLANHIQTTPNSELAGQGASTIFKGPSAIAGNTYIQMAADSTVRDISVVCNGPYGIQTGGDNDKVLDSFFSGSLSGTAAIYVHSNDAIIRGNTLNMSASNTTHGIYHDQDGMVAVENILTNTAMVVGSNSQVAQNKFFNGDPSFWGGLQLAGSGISCIANLLDMGADVQALADTGGGNSILANVFISSGIINLEGTDGVFASNFIKACMNAARAILLNTAAVGYLVQGNEVRGTTPTNSLSFAAGSTDNTVVLNDFRGGYATAAIGAGGVGNQLNLDGSANNWNRT